MENVKTQDDRVIQDSQFGTIDVDSKYVFNFPDGIFGFEELREFVLISEDKTVPFKWLIAIDRPEIGFPMLSPWHVDLSYKPGKQFDPEKDVLLVVITLENEQGVMTANMKAPIVLDVDNQTGKQVILSSEKYSPYFEIKLGE